MKDQKTDYLKLPLPHEDNELADDLPRLRAAFAVLDAKAQSQDMALAREVASREEALADIGAETGLSIAAESAARAQAIAAESAAREAALAAEKEAREEALALESEARLAADAVLSQNLELAAARAGIADAKAGSAGEVAAAALPKAEYTAHQAMSGQEWDTGETWIDGRKIYARVIDIGVLPNATSKEVPVSIAGLDHMVPPLAGTAQPITATTHSNTLPLPFAAMDANCITLFWKEDAAGATSIYIKTSAGFHTHTGFVILRYVKTGEE